MQPLGIFQDRYAKAYSKPGDEEEASFTLDSEGLLQQYDTDAHFCLYHVEGESSWPRLSKTSPGQIEEQGTRVMVQYLAVDWDTPGHVDWDPQTFEEFFHKLDEVEVVFPEVAQFSTLYTTRRGAHLVWTLDDAVEPHTAEGMLRGLTSKLRRLGLEVDELCDWTRLMRCPNVVRDGKYTSDAPFYLVESFDRTVSVEDMPYVKTEKRTFSKLEDIPDDLPELKGVEETHPCYKLAKQRLIGRKCYDAMFGNQCAESFGAPGRRNTNLFKHVGQAVGLLYPTGQFDAEKIFQLFFLAVSDLPDESTEDPMSQLWRAVRTAWSRQSAQEDQIKEKDQEVEDRTLSLWESITSGFLEWSKVPGVEDEEEARAYLQDKLILITSNGGSMIMQPNGYYDRAEISKSQLVSRVRQLGMSSLINCTKAKTEKKKSAQDILDIYGLPVGSVAAGPEYEKGTVVTGMHTPLPCAILPMFERNSSLTPQYNEDVDLWLRKICKTNEDHDKLIHWIGWALEFSHPVAALAIIGPGGIGKKLLMLGLAECFLPTKIADFTNIVSGFGDVLLETPLLWANEGFPQNSGSGKRIADLIRELVAGDPISINRKFKTPVQIQANYRIVVTANNEQCLTGLYSGQDLTTDDRMAIAQRIVHIDASASARIWLRQMGGLAFTGKPGARWVANQSGGTSDYVVARHFLWINENRQEVAHGARFAVEGSLGAGSLVDDMALNSGIAPTVVETLLLMGKSASAIVGMKALIEPDDEHDIGIYVTTAAVRDAYRRFTWARDTKNMTDRKIANVLMSLSDKHSLSSIDGLRAMWYKINTDFLIAQAYKTGSEVGPLFKPFA